MTFPSGLIAEIFTFSFSIPSSSQIIVNGYKLTERSYIYDTNDAQIIIEGVPQNAKSIEVGYHVTMIDNPFYEDMVGLLRAREEERLARKQEFSYRLKRKAGIIKEDNLPEGFVRADLTK